MSPICLTVVKETRCSCLFRKPGLADSCPLHTLEKLSNPSKDLSDNGLNGYITRPFHVCVGKNASLFNSGSDVIRQCVMLTQSC